MRCLWKEVTGEKVSGDMGQIFPVTDCSLQFFKMAAVQLPGLLGRLRPQAPAPTPSRSLENPGSGRHVCHHVEHLHGFPARVLWSVLCCVVLQVICFVSQPPRQEEQT